MLVCPADCASMSRQIDKVICLVFNQPLESTQDRRVVKAMENCYCGVEVKTMELKPEDNQDLIK